MDGRTSEQMQGRPLRRYDGFGSQVLVALVLAPLSWWAADPSGRWLGLTGRAWLAAAIAIPVVHQLVAGLGWRAELFDRWFTRRFDDRALAVFGAMFLPLFALRPLAVLGVAVADRGSLWSPGPVAYVAAAMVAAPALWTFVSVIRYFGLRRALGVDHFDPDFDEPFVRRGAFAIVPNAMYVFAFLLLWAIGVAAGSRAAVVAAAFQHIFIWAHYRWIESQDMQVIYGDRPTAPGPGA